MSSLEVWLVALCLLQAGVIVIGFQAHHRLVRRFERYMATVYDWTNKYAADQASVRERVARLEGIEVERTRR